MAIFNLGSINIDLFYQVDHLPAPGETIAATQHHQGLGGKGANQSVAAAKAGATVRHIGAVGQGADWIVDRLQGVGVDTSCIAVTNHATGHAMIVVDQSGENTIVLFQGANVQQDPEHIRAALAPAKPGDILLLQNETDGQVTAAQIAQEKGLVIVYSAAPFSVNAVRDILPWVTILVVNEVEAQQLQDAFGTVDVPQMIVTRGAKGASWTVRGEDPVQVSSFPVEVVDTTGAGDCFIGSAMAALDAGADRAGALRFAAAAAAIKVSRAGTADAMPTRDEVEAFLKTQ